MTHWNARSQTIAPLAFGIVLICSAGVGAHPSIDLVWSDPYGLLPAVTEKALASEVDRFAAVSGIPVRLRFDEAEPGGSPRIHVSLRPGGGGHWGLPGSAMAVAIGKRSIFVFLPAVRHTLGHPASAASARELSELTRALARVLEHELIHVLAPDRGHASAGLMSRRLTRKRLLAQRVCVDLTSVVRARNGALRLAGMDAPAPAPPSSD